MFNFVIYLTILLWPFFMGVELIDIGVGVPTISLLRLVVLLLLVFFLVYRLITRNSIKFDLVVKSFMLFLIIIICHLIVTGFTSARLQTLLDVYILPVVFYFILINSKESLHKKYLVSAVLLSGALMGFVGVLEAVLQRNIYGPENIRMAGDFYRTNGTFEDGIVFASVLLLFVPFGYYCHRKGIGNKLLLFSSLLICSLASALQLSRACLLALLLIFPLLFFAKTIRSTLAFTYISLLLVFTPLYFVHEAFQNSAIYEHRIANISNITGRYERDKYLLNRFIQKPVFGAGFNRINEELNAHNTYLQNLVELGLLGFPIWALFIFSPFVVVHGLAGRNSFELDYKKSMVSVFLIITLVPLTVSSLNAMPMMFQYLTVMASYQCLFIE